MKDTVEIFGKDFEYDFLSAWIKYNRLQHEFSQEALSYGICSKSHLSYFENGKKKLRGDIIEALLKKLNIHKITELNDIGLIRHKFYNMMFQIESSNDKEAKVIYNELLSLEDLISISPYNVEYKIYQLMYNIFIEKKPYSDLKQDILSLDKIYSSLNNELQYIYMLLSGKLIYKYKSHDQGLERLTNAYKLKETPWINYILGFSYCFNAEPLKGTYHLEKALESYEKNGRYINAIWCHDNLGICYAYLKLYDKAEMHYKAALNGAEHFNISNIFYNIYTNLSALYFYKKDYEESIKWVKKALKADDDPILPACNCIDAYIQLHKFEECIEIFNKYLTPKYEQSKYYNFLYFLYLSLFHFEENLFYDEVTQKILPYYKGINYIEICRQIKLTLIEYLEKKRKYKEANSIYKELIS